MSYNGSAGAYSTGTGQSSQWAGVGATGDGANPDPNMLLQQIQQLQKTVQQLQTNGGGQSGGGYSTGASYGAAGAYGGYGNGATAGTTGYSNYQGNSWSGPRAARSGSQSKNVKTEDGEGLDADEQKVLLVSNIPPTLSNPDSLFYAFEKFGVVARVKILHNKRNTALIQMTSHEEAERAVNEQEKLNRVGTDIYVNFSSKFREIKVPEPGSLYDDGLTKDFTGEFPNSGQMGPQPPRQQHGGFGPGGGYDDGMGSFGMGGGGSGGFGMGGGQNYGRGGMGGGGRGGFSDYGDMGRGGGGGQGGVVLLVSNIPEEIANVNYIFNMIGMYGDVLAVKILRNKPDCCMVQLAKPHHAQQVRNFLDQAKVGGKKLCVSNSHVESLLNKRMPEEDELQMDFSNSRNHRYRNHQMAAKLTKNLGPPSSTLHVANLPDDLTHVEIKDMFIERGFTVKESKECGTSGNMALLTMTNPEEALRALAVMHNYAPEEYKFKNAAGLCVSFSSARSQHRERDAV